MDGTIGYEGESGKGSRFWFTIVCNVAGASESCATATIRPPAFSLSRLCAVVKH